MPAIHCVCSFAMAVPPEMPAIPVEFCGPPTRPLKGVVPVSAAFSLPRGVRDALREVPGAVVVVEDTAPVFLTQLPPHRRFRPLNVRVFGGPNPPIFPGTPPMPVWMDPSITISGGNIVHRVFTFGGGNF